LCATRQTVLEPSVAARSISPVHAKAQFGALAIYRETRIGALGLDVEFSQDKWSASHQLLEGDGG
jgi:hypothetical protein